MKIKLPPNKTKIVCTIGPASRSATVLKRMIKAGMNVARLNFSHGGHEDKMIDINMIRAAAKESGAVVAILADLPGPKIRIGKLKGGCVNLKKGEEVTFTTKPIEGVLPYIPVQFKGLPQSVKEDGIIYLNDGFIQLKVLDIQEHEVRCKVIIGGQLLSHKGLNLPGAKITVDAVTQKDLEHVKFGLENGIDTFCVSFANSSKDIMKVKRFAQSLGKEAYVIAKIERNEAVENIDDILAAADGIMVARGDLGVEIPIENVPVVQKMLINKANIAGKPVITATQMLESMVDNIRPTRAEATDVANAILDGTDAVMLSEETSIGKFPVFAIEMMASVASITETQRSETFYGRIVNEYIMKKMSHKGASGEDVISLDVAEALNSLDISYVLAPTKGGGMVRRISRFKPGKWILAFTMDKAVRDFMVFSYGVYPILLKNTDCDADLIKLLKSDGLVRKGNRVLISRRLHDDEMGKSNSLKIVSLK